MPRAEEGAEGALRALYRIGETRRATTVCLGLAEVEWVTTERGKGSPFIRLEERMRPGRYDLVLFLVSFLPRGYSVTSVVQAISQLLSKRVP